MLLTEIAQPEPKVYLVGGAVRDQLLGRPVKDHDYVVVGATPEYMEQLGFEQVGADFPVFLHPKTKDEYALARTERKTGKGYHGFETKYDPSVSLEDDLRRRDLTINAIAYDPKTKEYVDPFGGREDLQRKIIRHVSDAFAEDPLRVLRVARFRARYGWEIAPETLQLMKKLNPELKSLTKERVWLELEKTMTEQNPQLFFDTLQKRDSLKVLFPDVNWTPRVSKLMPKGEGLEERIALLLADTSVSAAKNFLQRWKAPNNVRSLVVPFKKLSEELKNGPPKDPQKIVQLIQTADGWRKPDLFRKVLVTLQKAGHDISSLKKGFESASKIAFASLSPGQQQALKGAQVGQAISKLRIDAVSQAISR